MITVLAGAVSRSTAALSLEVEVPAGMTATHVQHMSHTAVCRAMSDGLPGVLRAKPLVLVHTAEQAKKQKLLKRLMSFSGVTTARRVLCGQTPVFVSVQHHVTPLP